VAELPVEILLVEDNPGEVELALHSLNEQNLAARVHVARDGVEALAFLLGPEDGAPRQVDPRRLKVILLDLRVPKVDGREVLKRLKADPVARTIPVVVLTSSREASDVAACYALGVNSYVVKPVNFAEFSEAVRTLGRYWLRVNELPDRSQLQETLP